ncbi:PQQ-dependent sugar dehydrogenase [Verrucomicrobia bacterium]|nr:PQQ-dependent sugar dehydrogenase [Verrucomicrobiota bacterium]
MRCLRRIGAGLVVLTMVSSSEGADLSLLLDASTLSKVRYSESHPGNPTRGEALVKDQTKLGCAVCHLVYGREINKGAPNLFGVGDKFGFEDLVLAVERPSETILPGFESVEIETILGEIFTGTLKRVSKAGYILSTATGKDETISFEQVAHKRESNLSLMPEGLTAGLSKEEYADLFAFLASLKTDQLDGLRGKEQSAAIQIAKSAVQLEPFIDAELSFVGPVWMSPLPGREGEFVVQEHELGKVWRLVKGESNDEKTLFFNLGSEVEMAADGLVGGAFHPSYHYNRRYFLKYNTKGGGQLKTVIEERVAARDSLRDSGMVARRLLEVDQPANNHNGGCLMFGPDGYLYAAFGDGGPQRDPDGHSQNFGDLKGSMIRVDVDSRYHGRPYGIPRDNPYISRHETDSLNFPEIWAFGFREPWRFSFDRETGNLWLGDVGQSSYEEISLVRKGRNYGWNVMEAFHEFSDEYRRAGETFSPPLFAYSRKLGTSVTGGYVYRGQKDSPLYGYYICGDHESRRLFALKMENDRLEEVWELGFAPQRIASFCETNSGELLLVGYQGMIYRMKLDEVELVPRFQ